MATIIIPVAGRSSRFQGMRPKWLLTMPDGKLMVEKCIEGIQLNKFERLILVCLREHIERYLSPESLQVLIDGFREINVEICVLDEPTRSQSETVALALQKNNVSGPFFVKDCDNSFDFSWSGGNEIAVLDLNSVGLIDAKSKSYVMADSLGHVSNIVEKQVVSNLFCCGGYGFRSPSAYLSHFRKLSDENEVYVSHVIYSMLMGCEQFKIGYGSDYIDWGTAREYNHYTKQYATILCDVDGVLLYNGSKFGKYGWNTQPIIENLRAIAELQAAGRIYLIVTSSRPESQIEYVARTLAEYSVRADRYIMGLPHAQRILINDYAATNPYPSAVAMNVERDSKNLSMLLGRISGL